jgi:uncharacterized integral membrane protein
MNEQEDRDAEAAGVLVIDIVRFLCISLLAVLCHFINTRSRVWRISGVYSIALLVGIMRAVIEGSNQCQSESLKEGEPTVSHSESGCLY